MIELRNISAGYGKDNVIRAVSLLFPKGKLISVIGTNGSGKSTLLKTAIGILQPSSGEILVDGRTASGLSRQDTAKKISYLAQGRDTPDMAVKQMVLHGRFPHLHYPRRYGEQDIRIAQAAMERMGIIDIANRPLSSLSGGMRQKVYIAMALTQDTDYIMLDEPTTYLDISGQLELMKILRELADNGKGIIAVMHDLPLAFSCSDSIAVLKGGKLAACGTPFDLCKSGMTEEIFGVGLQYEDKTGCYHYRYTLK